MDNYYLLGYEDLYTVVVTLNELPCDNTCMNIGYPSGYDRLWLA